MSRTIQVRLEDTTVDALSSLAKTQGKPRAKVIAQALEALVDPTIYGSVSTPSTASSPGLFSATDGTATVTELTPLLVTDAIAKIREDHPDATHYCLQCEWTGGKHDGCPDHPGMPEAI